MPWYLYMLRHIYHHCYLLNYVVIVTERLLKPFCRSNFWCVQYSIVNYSHHAVP